MLSIWDTSTDEASEVASWGNCSPELRRRLRAHAQFAKVRRSIGGALESSFQEIVRRPTFDIWRWHLQESGHPVAAEIWERAATIQLSGSSHALVIPRLRQRGILSLLEGDVDILTTIATIGIANTLSTRRADVYFLASILGLEPEQVELAEREAKVVNGMHLLLRRDDYLIALV